MSYCPRKRYGEIYVDADYGMGGSIDVDGMLDIKIGLLAAMAAVAVVADDDGGASA